MVLGKKFAQIVKDWDVREDDAQTADGETKVELAG